MKKHANTFSLRQLVKRSLLHYRGEGIATAAGIAIATAILCGALIIGDSLRASLLQNVSKRLGETTHTVTAGERIFTRGLAERMEQTPELTTSSALSTTGVASVQGTEMRVNDVQVWGIDSLFHEVTGGTPFHVAGGEAVINEKLAGTLNLAPGDYLLLRIRTRDAIADNTPFVSTDNQTISRRVKVAAIADEEASGNFHLQHVQTTPMNLFVPLQWLNRIMGTENAANLVLIKDADGRNAEALDQLVKTAWHPADGNLQLRYLPGEKGWLLSSQRVFLDHHLADTITYRFPGAARHLTYFANSFRSGNNQTPYSFVTATDRSEEPFVNLTGNDAIISQWLADDLQLAVGDTFEMYYYLMGPLRELEETHTRLVVSHILPMETLARDSVLMPHLPGLSDAGSCAGWDAGVPVDLEQIRQKDEDYWADYRGTPKVFIALELGLALWENRFGTLTSMLIPGNPQDEELLNVAIGKEVDPARIGFTVNEVRDEGIRAAKGGVDFAQLFASLGFFIILSGLLLTFLLLLFNLKKREEEIKIYTTVGFPVKTINRIFLAESVMISLAGAILGVLVAIAYSHGVFYALNHLWHDIVRTETLILRFRPAVLALGGVAGWIPGIVVTAVTLNRYIKRNTRNITKSDVQPQTEKPVSLRQQRRPSRILFVVLAVAVSAFTIYLIATQQFDAYLTWFVAGGMVLPTILSAFWIYLHRIPSPAPSLRSTHALIIKNLRRNPWRSFTIVALLALGTFVVLVTAANHRQLPDMDDPASGTGAFRWIAESSVPILHDLNDPEVRDEYGLDEALHFVPLFTAFEDDASCLNLNRVENPRIVAVDPAMLHGRFRFTGRRHRQEEADPWELLHRKMDGVVPAVADHSVIRWGLGLNIGDTLHYRNAMGEVVKLLLVAGLENSVFQGNIIISHDNFLTHFPTSAGANLFLIDDPNHTEEAEYLTDAFRDHGWEMETTAERLARFQSVENTYLAIFFWMGALGMLVGTVGLAIFIAGTMVERAQETNLLATLGFPPQKVFRIYFTENFILLTTGIVAGILAAALATIPSFIGKAHQIAPMNIVIILSALWLNGMAWIGVIVKRRVGRG